MSKVLVIGLDGGSLDLILQWVKAGKLPTIASLMTSGSYGNLHSVIPVLSSAAWPSFMTGSNPGKHSIYDFVQRDLANYRLRFRRRDQIMSPSLWKILSQQDRRVGVINVPMTYPPEHLNGFIIPGLGTPDTPIFTYPGELSRDLHDIGYRVNRQVAYVPGNEDAYLEEINSITERQIAATLMFIRKEEWDFFMTVFFDSDQLSHFFWRYMDPSHPLHDPDSSRKYKEAILNYYQKIDGFIRQLIDVEVQDTDIIIMSDHGSGPLHKDVYLNEWLRKEGYLVLDDEVAQYRGPQEILAGLGITRRKIATILRRVNLGWVEEWISTHLGDLVYVLPRTQRPEFPSSIDWSHTSAYSFGYQGQIYINLIGREGKGIVPPGTAYDKLIEELCQKLIDLRDPDDGKPVVDQIFRKEDIFSGPYVGMAPDLTLVMRNLSYITRFGYEHTSQPGKIFTQPITFESGSHRQEGLLIISGPNIKTNGGSKQIGNLIDLAPTILYLLGCSIPTEMDGRVLRELIHFDHEPVYSNDLSPIEHQTGEGILSEEEEQKMIQRLKKMGYLE